MDRRWNQHQHQQYGAGSSSQSNPMSILGAENYLDGNTLFVAQSLADLAQQQMDAPQVSQVAGMGYTFEMTRQRAVTPEALNARTVSGVKRRVSGGENDRRDGKEKASKTPDAKSPEPESQAGKKKRKRKADQDDDEDAEDESGKKSRGRPRLETKDETAADRRRTQIRMAQRAYRNRKETTITSLEQQVEKLQSDQEQMNRAFLGLYELAVTKGLIQKEPEFGRQLQSATKHFVSKAKGNASNDLARFRSQDTSNHLANSESSSQSRGHANSMQLGHEVGSHGEVNNPPMWGYTLSGASDEIDYSHQKRWLEQSHMPPPPRPRQHQIIATASEQNASFPFDMYHYNTNLPGPANPANTGNFNPAPNIPATLSCLPFDLPRQWNQFELPPVETYAHTETTFARRLHRTIIERGLHLITSPNPDPRIWERVFGLSLRLYSREMMTQVLREVLAQQKGRTLNAWNLPFIHLGGAGTHFPPAEQDINTHAMPNWGTGMSMGPLIQSVAETREKFLVDDFRANIPGYEGEWFDSNDVEVYLRGRGVVIPGDAEWVTIDLDKVTLVNEDGTVTSKSVGLTHGSGTRTGTARSIGTTANPPSPQTPRSSIARVSNAGSEQQGMAAQVNDMSLELFLAGVGNGTQGNLSMPQLAQARTDDNGFTDWMGQNIGLGQEQKRKSSNAGFVGQQFYSHPVTGATNVSRFPESGIEMPPSEQFNPRLLTLSVSTLVEYIGRRGVCLGRAPGFRPHDIDSALRRTIQEADIGGMFS